ncbi:transketolase-like TK C-terminal-containing protein [Streptomyces sp. NPDC018964]|uniref:transketolase-like TK C-terminal-containing protein n=1 Tax=unclassified Streptomyces TaxID=2593676 RepID=UPI00378942D0
MTAAHPPRDSRTGTAPRTYGEDRGGYVLAEASAEPPDALLVAAAGDESVALAARAVLEAESIATRVVVLPHPDRFARQDAAYRDALLPPGTPVRVSVEAGAALGWYALLSGAGQVVGIEEFGARAPYRSLYRHAGLTPERVAAAVRAALARTRRKAA